MCTMKIIWCDDWSILCEISCGIWHSKEYEPHYVVRDAKCIVCSKLTKVKSQRWHLIYWYESWQLSYHISCWMKNDRDSIIYLRGVESIYEVKIDRKLKCIVWIHSERFFLHDKIRNAHDVRESFTYIDRVWATGYYYADAIDIHIDVVWFETRRSFDVYHMFSLFRILTTSQIYTSEKRVWKTGSHEALEVEYDTDCTGATLWIFFFFFFNWPGLTIFHRNEGWIQPPEYGRWLWKSIRYADGVKIWIQPLRFFGFITRWMWVLTTNFPWVFYTALIVCGFNSSERTSNSNVKCKLCCSCIQSNLEDTRLRGVFDTQVRGPIEGWVSYQHGAESIGRF